MKTRMMVVVAMLMSSLVFAQGHKRGGERDGMHHVEKMKSVLNLTDPQYAQVKSIDEKYASKFAELRKDSTARKENREVMKSLRTAKENEIESVLTAEQKTKWAAHREAQKKKHDEQRKEHTAKMGEKMKSELSLTDAQETRLKASNEKFKAKMKGLHDSDSKENQGEFKKLKAEHNAEIKSILTAEQFEKWKSMRKDGKHKHH